MTDPWGYNTNPAAPLSLEANQKVKNELAMTLNDSILDSGLNSENMQVRHAIYFHLATIGQLCSSLFAERDFVDYAKDQWENVVNDYLLIKDQIWDNPYKAFYEAGTTIVVRDVSVAQMVELLTSKESIEKLKSLLEYIRV